MSTARADRVDHSQLLDFITPRHKAILTTVRRDGRPQLSPVAMGVDEQGRIVISTYPERAKTANARKDPRVSVCVLSDDWDGAWVQVDGHAEVLDMPEALESLSATTGSSPASIPTGTTTARPCSDRTRA